MRHAKYSVTAELAVRRSCLLLDEVVVHSFSIVPAKGTPGKRHSRVSVNLSPKLDPIKQVRASRHASDHMNPTANQSANLSSKRGRRFQFC